MTKRNLTILIIIIVSILAIYFGYVFFTSMKTTPTGTTQPNNFFSGLFPFTKSTSKTPTSTTPPADISGFVPTPIAEATKAKLTKVSTIAIAGFGIFQKQRLINTPVSAVPAPIVPTTPITPVTTTTKTKTAPVIKPIAPPTEFVPALRYVEKATGNIYQTFADTIAERKLSSIMIPQVSEAFFGNNGDSVIMRYLKDDGKTIETFLGTLTKEILGVDTAGDNKVTGSFLPENITDVSIAPDSSKIFYLFNTNDLSTGVTSDFISNKKSQIFQSPFTEWLSTWPNLRMVTVTTKPASGVPGYIYSIDPTTKALNRVLGGFNGLTTLTSPSGKLILYGKDDLSMNIYDTSSGASTLLGIKTLPEKCVWGKNSDVAYCSVPNFINPGLYPDSWYQGETNFSDNIWKIDAKNGNTTLIADLMASNGGETIDGTKLALDASEGYLFFVNKRDSFLWELTLK